MINFMRQTTGFGQSQPQTAKMVGIAPLRSDATCPPEPHSGFGRQPFILPGYLDRFIFNDLHGVYTPDYKKAESNLHNSREDNLKYLGTYLPRSMAESFNIFDELYDNPLIRSMFTKKDKLRVLDIGAGTGGNSLGFVYALNRADLGSKPVSIISIDGNEDALDYQKILIGKMNEISGSTIGLQQIHFEFYSGKEFTESLHEIAAGQEFDVVMVFKFVSEFLNRDFSAFKGLYQDLTRLVSDLLNCEGLFIIADVVSRDSNQKRDFTSVILSQEIAGYLQESTETLSPIVPVPCGLWAPKCRGTNCYTERGFSVSHTRKQNIMDPKIRTIC